MRFRIATLIAVAGIPAAAQRTPLVATTDHTIIQSNQQLRYRAIVAETFLKDATGTPVASVVTTAYVRQGIANQSSRPVLFLFNGGPGASSTPLHFNAFGPMLRRDEASGQRMVENPASPIDAVDLVFIDPVGTGYSRPFPGVDGKQFWSRTSDARAVRMVIEDWLSVNGRASSPLYLCGESYGTTRAALILKDPGSLHFQGVLLFALVANPSAADGRFIGTLPSYATTAWFHERIARNGRTVAQMYDEAVKFATGEYASALTKGTSLTGAERRTIAARMSSLTGLSVDLIERRNLRVAKDTFMFNLLKDRDVRTGQLDGRATARFDAPRQRPPYDDPGLNYNPEAVTPSAVTPAGGSPVVDTYFRTTLKFPASETYNALNLDVNAAWNHEGMTDVNAIVGEVMRADPGLRMFWAGGYFDISTPLFAGRLALDQAGIPSDRLTVAAFSAGHSVFTETTNRSALSESVRRFVQRR